MKLGAACTRSSTCCLRGTCWLKGWSMPDETASTEARRSNIIALAWRALVMEERLRSRLTAPSYSLDAVEYVPRAQSILCKVGLDLVTLAPMLNSYFFDMQSLSDYGTANRGLLRWFSAAQRINDSFPRACVEGIFFWTSATAINLALVPLQFHYILQGMAGIVWLSVLSTKNSTARKEAAQIQSNHPLVAILPRNCTGQEVAVRLPIAEGIE
ncbi:hypothetical protein FA10DRAFT_270004 [Acaromyces ingoldii]|uniref:Uncharacterized protein n=1 Tax=Acaromyces ingoldii TaxID=215250 RepID=A0A316YF06_9BASI|nr:hypothetical protein FA10DRAFT_270004 [Acaromyces ingoldii]PWN86633.1 hypothetical protein FA10DRAFT_270004 [Acaromyces ingoldii]